MGKPWRYKLDEAFRIHVFGLDLAPLETDFVYFNGDEIVIKPGYAWDGCSPTVCIHLGNFIPQNLWLGPWDGGKNADGRPCTYYASLVHDALCQYRPQLKGCSKEKATQVFADLMRVHHTPEWMVQLYSKAVYYFGPQHWQ